MHTKWTARRLAADAMFAAMVTVLGLASISTGNLKITVEALPVFLGALLLGPVDGLAIGGVGTLLYQLLSLRRERLDCALDRTVCAAGAVRGRGVGAARVRLHASASSRCWPCSAELGITALNTGSLYVDSLIYGYYSPVFVFGTLPLRLGICAAKAVVFSLLLPSLLPLVRRAVQPHAN
ncbi:MAG: ECF transporter S component [Oscillospiraceae bacterium]